MDSVKILVVEDEIIIADNLCDTLEELGYAALEPALNYSEGLEIINQEKPDIAILDIELGGKKTGIDLAFRIKEEYNFPFIFLTSNADAKTLEKAKEVNPAAFLVKPFTKDELFTSIEIALSNFSKSEPKVENKILVKNALFIKDKGVFKKIKFSDILYLKSEHVYTEIVLIDNTIQIVRASLNSIIENLTSDFIRVHRSYIINTKYLTHIDKSSLKMESKLVPLGEKYKNNLLNRINLA